MNASEYCYGPKKGIFINALQEICVGVCGIATRHATGTSYSNSHGTPPQLKRNSARRHSAFWKGSGLGANKCLTVSSARLSKSECGC
jgi:hypothetical protein